MKAEKPHIFKAFGNWWCCRGEFAHSHLGRGHSPEAAFIRLLQSEGRGYSEIARRMGWL